MRLVLKASLLLLVTIGVQYVINAGVRGGPLDEAQFTVHVYVANLAGMPDNHDSLVNAATNLMRRREERSRRLYPDRWGRERVTAAGFDPVMDVG